MTHTPVSLIRISDGRAASFGAVHSADALDVVADWLDAGQDADTLPWESLPGAEQYAINDLSHRPRRSVVALGTAVDGEWTSWFVPGVKPAVPEWNAK
jgi:hypothetical protein